MKRSWVKFILGFPASLLIGCAGQAPLPRPPAPRATAPAPASPPAPAAADDWPTATPEEEGLDSKALADLLESIRAQGDPVDSVLIVRDGRLVLDACVYPFRDGLRHAIHSGTKSVISMLLGIANGDGTLPDIERPVLDFFPGRSVAHLDDRKRAMRLKHLLTMSSGLDWEEDIPYWRPQNSATRIAKSPDPVQSFLDTPMSVDPGTRFNYNSGGSHLLSAILQKATGESALEFARSRLFGPVGISEVTWEADARGVSLGGNGLWIQPRDLARLGELYRNNGVWKGRRIVPEAWVRDSVKPWMTSGSFGYGYQWWLPPSGGYAARGFGGQLLWVLPDLRMVVVMTGGSQDGWLPGTLTELFILPAVKAAGPLQANPGAAASLAAAAQAVAQPQPRPAAPLPAIAREITGRAYTLDDNGLGLKSFSLSFETGEATIELHFQDKSVKLPVGLDNVFRFTDLAGIGTVAERGAWTDDHTFQLDERFLGESYRSEIRLDFAEDRVEATAKGLDSGFLEIFEGRRVQAIR